MTFDSARDDLDVEVWPLEHHYAEPCPVPPPDDADAANRMLGRLRRIDRLRSEAKAAAGAELARIQEWLDGREATLDRQAEWLQRGVESWGRAVHADDPKRRTIKLPNGEVWIRPRQDLVEVLADQEGLRVLAKAHPGFVRPGKLEPAKKAIADEVLPGGPVVGDVLVAALARPGYEPRQAIIPAEAPPDAKPGDEDPPPEVLESVFVLVPVTKNVLVRPAP